MGGWKTWFGAAVMAVSAALRYLGYAEIADALEKFALAIIAVGIGHKIEKIS